MLHSKCTESNSFVIIRKELRELRTQKQKILSEHRQLRVEHLNQLKSKHEQSGNKDCACIVKRIASHETAKHDWQQIQKVFDDDKRSIA